MTSLAELFGARTAAIVPEAISAPAAAALRARLAARWQRYTLLDRGSYAYVDRVDEPALISELARRAAQLAGRPLAITEVRALRLVPGDYVFAHHDALHEGLPLELVLDLSPAAVAGAEVHYRRRGHVVFRVPCAPCTLAVVERGPTVTRNHTYVSRRHPPDAEVVRLVLLAREAA